MKKASEQIKIAGLYVELTSQCNLRCLHCYNESGASTHRIDEKSFRNIIKKIEDPMKVSVTLSGGEPLLHPDLWKYIEILQQEGFGQSCRKIKKIWGINASKFKRFLCQYT